MGTLSAGRYAPRFPPSFHVMSLGVSWDIPSAVGETDELSKEHPFSHSTTPRPHEPDAPSFHLALLV